MKKFNAYALPILQILLGLIFLETGTTKISAPMNVVGMLSHIGFPIPSFFAWLLIVIELVGSVSLLANYKVKYTAPLLGIVLIIAGFTTSWGKWVTLLFHLIGAAALWVIAAHAQEKAR